MGHPHHHHVHAHFTPTLDRAFRIGIFINLLFVAAEFAAGLYSGSMGLISDAGHNLSDVASMLLALSACLLAARKATPAYTYGYKKSTILVSLTNAVILLLAVGFILIESIGKLFAPVPVSGDSIMIVAGIGVAVNGLTTYLFAADKAGDINIRATYLHMLADTLVSIGVVLSGLLIRLTGWYTIDPIIGIAIALLILVSTWSVLRESLRLALDGTPEQFDLQHLQERIEAVEGVAGAHHLHIWAISTTEYALTGHIVVRELQRLEPVKRAIKSALAEEGIAHVTLEFESEPDDCTDRSCC